MYEIQVTFSLYDGSGNHDSHCSNRFDLLFSFDDLEDQEMYWTQDLTPVGGTPTTFTKTFDLPFDRRLWRIHLFGERQFRNAGGCKGPKQDSWLYPDYSSGCWSYESDNFFGSTWSGHTTFKIVPKTMNLFYFNRAGQQEISSARWYLPQSHAITIKATQGYTANNYQWKYRIGSSGGYSNMPGNLYSGSVATFSGQDLIPDFLNTVLKYNLPIYILVDKGCGGTSQEMILQSLLSAPNFTSVTGIAPTCSYLTDGKIKVALNRPLEINETVSFTIDGVPYRIENLTKNDFDADLSYTMTSLPASTNRRISFVGFYNGRNTYTDDPQLQNSVVTIPVRTPITYTATPQAVHCFDGADGKVSVTAQGGNQQYTAFFSQNGNDIGQQTFSEGTSAVFRRPCCRHLHGSFAGQPGL